MVIQIRPTTDEQAILLEKAKNVFKVSTYSKAFWIALEKQVSQVEKEMENQRRAAAQRENAKK